MRYDGWLERWRGAGLLDDAMVERIREFELAHSTGLGWPVRILIAFGGIAIGAGVLLFVAAHWDELSPLVRFLLVLSLVAVFHAGGAMTHGRFKAMSTTLHGLGTATLGAGIFLAAQIFHLAEHWPGGVMLWALGAWAGWFLLRDWPHAVWVASLTPLWLVGEWHEAASGWPYEPLVATGGLALLMLAYLCARSVAQPRAWHGAVGIIGTTAILPVTIVAIAFAEPFAGGAEMVSPALQLLGWSAMLVLPVAVGFVIDRGALRPMLLGALWLVVMSFVVGMGALLYLWCTIGSMAMVVWGLRGARRERINLGVIGFALTVLFFYFSSVADKLDRALGLVALGVLLLAGGWALERTRRRLLARITEGSS